MAGILAAGIFLRFFQLQTEELWLDEGTSVRIAHVENAFAIFRPGTLDDNPPLYYFLLHGWVAIFGDSPFSVRFMSALFGSACIVMVWRIALSLFDSRTALIAALLIALSGYHVYHSQQARPYTLWALLALGNFYTYIRLVDKPRAVTAGIYLLCGAMMLYTHPYSPLLLVAQNIHYFMLVRKPSSAVGLKIRHWIWLEGILVVVFLPWLIVIVKRFIVIQKIGAGILRPRLVDLPGMLVTFSGQSVWVALFFIVLAGIAMCVPKIKCTETPDNSHASPQNVSNIPHQSKIQLLLLWLLIPTVPPFLLSFFFTPVYHHRYAVAASFGFYLLVAYGATRLYTTYLFVPALAVMLSFYPLENISRYTRVNNIPFSRITSIIEQNAGPGDAVIIYPRYLANTLYSYYSRRTDLNVVPFPHYSSGDVAQAPALIEPLISRQDQIWLILIDDELYPLLLDRLRKTHTLKLHQTFDRLHMMFFINKSSSPTADKIPDPPGKPI